MNPKSRVRRGLIYFLSSVVLACLLIPRPALAEDICSSLAPVCIQEVDSTLLGERLPLILIHGLNASAISAPPQTDGWNNFLDYYNANPALKAIFKPYLISYYSNVASISDLGNALCEALDKTNQGDPDNFGNKNVVLIGHSMGGLVARSSLTFQQNYGAFSGKTLQERALKTITLATPHHGSPLANGPARDQRAGIGWKTAIDSFELLFWSSGPAWNQVNRSDLRWDNYDGLLNYDSFPDENNFWLSDLNRDRIYDSKIIAYGGAIAPGYFCWSDQNCWGTTVLGGVFDLANDGVVPLGSARFEGHSVATRYFSDYNHSEMIRGKNSSDPSLFDRIRDDLLNTERPADKAILISPSGYTGTSAPTYSWSAVLGTNQYLLEVNNSTGASVVLVWYTAKEAGCVSGNGVCSATPAATLENGSFQWRVRVRNDADDGPWSKTTNFSVALTKKGITWLSFTEGNPDIPGDGVFVGSDQGNFHPKPALALNEMTDGFTMSVFPTASTDKLLSVAMLVRPRSSGLGFYMIYSFMGMSALTSNGVNGLFFNVTQSQLQQIVNTISQISFENFTLNDVDIIELQINYPNSSRQSLDAVSIGRGQNATP